MLQLQTSSALRADVSAFRLRQYPLSLVGERPPVKAVFPKLLLTDNFQISGIVTH